MTKELRPDTLSLIRNPGMGWIIYDDASGKVANAKEFWLKQDTIARKYASCLYIRWRWSDMEPEEGKYAWEYDDNFLQLIHGALDRGMKLAFRVYVASQDNQYESTPPFVFDAGAKYYIEKGVPGELRSPYPDDPVFQEKFTHFIRAFAAKFDDAKVVDFVDGYNLGWWGEGHNLKFKDENKKEDTFRWIINLYGGSFKHVPLVITVDSEIGHELELKYAINANDYSVRRDGYGSTWMPESQKNLLKGLFPKCFIVAECCYWQDITIQSVNEIESKYKWDSWADYYAQVVNEALETHANYLDLREPVEAIRWTSQANNEVHKFLSKGGYRLYPSKINIRRIKQTLEINHEWKNLGVGILPNSNKNWGGKYKVAFALYDTEKHVIIDEIVDMKADPGTWVKGMEYNYLTRWNSKFLQGNRKLALLFSIFDTKLNLPRISLAIKSPVKIHNWYLAGEL